jgi:hypothetical protein
MSKADSTTTTIESFGAAYAEMAEFKPVYEAVMERRDAEIARRIGIPTHWSFRTLEEAEAHLQAMREVDKEMGIAQISERMKAFDLPLDRMVRRIIDKPVSDLASLALKANAVATARPELWQSIPDDLDWPEELIRDLIESVCILAGVDLIACPPARPPAPRSDLN